MKTNCPLKKGDDGWVGPHPIRVVYPRACLVDLPADMKIFPVFHTSLLRPRNDSPGLLGHDLINGADNRGCKLERENGTEEIIEKWEFEDLLDCHKQDELHYLIRWKHHAPS